jgi:hypothetical protein
LGSGDHCVHEELDTLGGRHPDLEQPAALVGADQHDQVVDGEHSNRVAVSVKHVVVADPVRACTAQDHRIHTIKLT